MTDSRAWPPPNYIRWVLALNFDGPQGGYANVGLVPSNMTSEDATFETWMFTRAKAAQSIFNCHLQYGAAPRISVGGDQLSVYWSAEPAAPSFTSSDTRPVTDGRWHHIAVVFSKGTITFYKDGQSTNETLSMPRNQPVQGVLQLGSGIGSTTDFSGYLWAPRVWAYARSAAQIANAMKTGIPAPDDQWGLQVLCYFTLPQDDPPNGGLYNWVNKAAGNLQNVARVIRYASYEPWDPSTPSEA